jgi:phospholipid/cholesterol/gamma-HCH transport system substrate-binding protein
VQGLKAGAVVRLAGKEIGTVTAVEFTPTSEVDVSYEVLEQVRPLITTESRAAIGSLSLLGEPIIDLTATGRGQPLEEWAYVPTTVVPAFSDLSTTAAASLQQMEQLLSDIRAGRGTLGRLVTDDRLYTELQAFITSAGDVTQAINAGEGTLGGLIKDPAAYQSLRASLENLQGITARINRGEGALGRFLHDEALGQSLSNTITNMGAVTEGLRNGEGTAGRLLTDQQLYDRLNSMASRLDEVMAGLESGDGTAGQLLQDRQLYENMNATVLEVRDLVAEIRKDPQKYLRVHVSIF